MSRRQRLLFAAVVVLTVGAVAAVGMRWHSARDVHRLAELVPGVAPLCTAAAESFCERLESCGVLAAEQEGECVRHHAHACDDDIGWRIRSGAVFVDDEAQEECLESLKGAHCNAVAFVYADDEQDIFELTTRCEMEEMLQPRAREGGACGASSDCAEGFCPSAELGCSHCRAFAAEGAPCVSGRQECKPGKASCRDGRCQALVPPGAACVADSDCTDGVCRDADGGHVCGAVPDGAPCLHHADCSRHSYCDLERHCRPRVATGGACVRLEDTDVCADSEASCVQGRCAVRPFDVPDGQPCRSFTDCRPGSYCRWRAVIGDQGVCARQWEVNGACRPFDVQSCPPSMRCVNGLCRPLASLGESCRAQFTCKAELDCVPDSSEAGAHCQALGQPGEPCGSRRSCATGLFCEEGRCSALRLPGAQCRAAGECASRRCLESDGGAGHCAGPC